MNFNEEVRLIVDYSSIMGAYLHIADDEFGRDITFEGKSWHIPDPQTVLERFQATVSTLEIPPEDFIVVCDPGKPCKERQIFAKQYKKKPRTSPIEFKECRESSFKLGIDWLRSMGATIATPKKCTLEADDLINEMATRLNNTIVWTRDKDLLAVPTDVMFASKGGVLEWNPEKFPVEKKYIPLYRALVVGDASDNLTSCKGFGPKTWEKMIEQFGEDSVDDLYYLFENAKLGAEAIELLPMNSRQKAMDARGQLFKEILPLVAEFKAFGTLIEQGEELLSNYRAMSFIKVRAHKIEWLGGMLAGNSTLVTTSNYDKAYSAIKQADYRYATIDYESDTCQESRIWAKNADIKVDVLGQEITGMGLRIGHENYYFSVDHADTDNITMDQLEAILELIWGKKIYAHNAGFEQVLTYTHFGTFLPDVRDTSIMASYVDENDYTNLKHLTKKMLGYQQQSYVDTLAGRSGMREVTGLEVVGYGIDDVITTDSLQRVFQLIMEYEGTLDVFNDVENDALYFTVKAFVEGVDFDREWYDTLQKQTEEGIADSWERLNGLLLDLNWPGGEFEPVSNMNIATLNKIHRAVHGTDMKDVTAVKVAIRMMEDRQLADLAENKDFEKLNDYYKKHWKPAADFNVRSPKQVGTLLYDVLKMKQRIVNKATPKMAAAGMKGNPATNEDAIQNALAWNDVPEHKELLEVLLEHKGFLTKQSLFLEKYPKYVHWKTGKIHAALRQSATTTRRFSCSAPNLNCTGLHQRNLVSKIA